MLNIKEWENLIPKCQATKKNKLTTTTNEIWISEKNSCLENRHYYLVTSYY